MRIRVESHPPDAPHPPAALRDLTLKRHGEVREEEPVEEGDHSRRRVDCMLCTIPRACAV